MHALLPPRPLDAEPSTKARILSVAARAFADQGYERATIRRIADLARVNLAAVNYHFGSKAGLYRAVIEEALASLRHALGGPARSEPRLDVATRAVVEAFLGAATEAGDRFVLIRLIAWELIRASEERPADEPSTSDEIRRLLIDRLPADWPRDDRAIAANWIVGQCLMFALPTLSLRFEAAERLSRLMLGGLYGLNAPLATETV